MSDISGGKFHGEVRLKATTKVQATGLEIPRIEIGGVIILVILILRSGCTTCRSGCTTLNLQTANCSGRSRLVLSSSSFLAPALLAVLPPMLVPLPLAQALQSDAMQLALA